MAYIPGTLVSSSSLTVMYPRLSVAIPASASPSPSVLGTRPTVNGDGVTCETFIPDFSGDIYGDRVPVRFCRFLWPTQKFGTLEELSAMVGRAAQAAREWRDE